jgi:hypothetical protein
MSVWEYILRGVPTRGEVDTSTILVSDAASRCVVFVIAQPDTLLAFLQSVLQVSIFLRGVRYDIDIYSSSFALWFTSVDWINILSLGYHHFAVR